MATITEIQLQDGSIHQLGGGGGGNTYTLTKNGDTITLSGSGGDTSSVTDSDTTYTVSVNGHTLTLTPSTGTAQTITLPDDDTTYTLSISGNTLTLTPSSGTPQSITIPILEYTIDAPDVGTSTHNVSQNDVENNAATGGYALAEGVETTASGERSHAEGYRSTASGLSSHAEGLDTEATGNHTHAEGNASVASGSGSHAEGSHSTASGEVSHAEGYYTEASGVRSHSTNNGTIAQRADQTVIGRFNEADTNGSDESALGKYSLIIGNGNDGNSRSNALAVDWQGNSEQKGRATTRDMTTGSGGEVEDFVNSLNVSGVSLKGFIKYKKHELVSSTTLAAHASTSKDVPFTAPNGYVLLGVVSAQTNGAVASIYPIIEEMGNTSGTITVWVRNASTASITINSFSIACLYIRSDLYEA